MNVKLLDHMRSAPAHPMNGAAIREGEHEHEEVGRHQGTRHCRRALRESGQVIPRGMTGVHDSVLPDCHAAYVESRAPARRTCFLAPVPINADRSEARDLIGTTAWSRAGRSQSGTESSSHAQLRAWKPSSSKNRSSSAASTGNIVFETKSGTLMYTKLCR